MLKKPYKTRDFERKQVQKYMYRTLELDITPILMCVVQTYGQAIVIYICSTNPPSGRQTECIADGISRLTLYNRIAVVSFLEFVSVAVHVVAKGVDTTQCKGVLFLEIQRILQAEIQLVVSNGNSVGTNTACCIAVVECGRGCVCDVSVEVGEVCTNGKVVENLITQTDEYLLEATVTRKARQGTDGVSVWVCRNGVGLVHVVTYDGVGQETGCKAQSLEQAELHGNVVNGRVLGIGLDIAFLEVGVL